MCWEVFTTASEIVGFSGTTLAPETGYEIWHVECQELLEGRLMENYSKGVREV
jgi:hypothetical protein